MHTSTSTPVTACTVRVVRPNLTSLSGGGVVLPAIRLTHPRVYVVPAPFPVPGDDLSGDLDAPEPLQALVAVHRRDVEPHRTAVVPAHRATEHRQGDEDVRPPCLVQGQALGVCAVEGGEVDGGGPVEHAGGVEQI